MAVYPDALPGVGGRPFWNMSDADPGRPDDVEFMRRLIATVQDGACTDPARVFATGMSNGGSITPSRLGCELSDRIAAIAPISGAYGSQPACTPVRPVSVMEVHGTLDHTVPYLGKANGYGAVRRSSTGGPHGTAARRRPPAGCWRRGRCSCCGTGARPAPPWPICASAAAATRFRAARRPRVDRPPHCRRR